MEWNGSRDDEWERIKDFLPGRVGHVGGTASDNRLFVDAILHRYRTGIPWRDLPALRRVEKYPSTLRPMVQGRGFRAHFETLGQRLRNRGKSPGERWLGVGR